MVLVGLKLDLSWSDSPTRWVDPLYVHTEQSNRDRRRRSRSGCSPGSGTACNKENQSSNKRSRPTTNCKHWQSYAQSTLMWSRSEKWKECSDKTSSSLINFTKESRLFQDACHVQPWGEMNINQGSVISISGSANFTSFSQLKLKPLYTSEPYWSQHSSLTKSQK